MRIKTFLSAILCALSISGVASADDRFTFSDAWASTKDHSLENRTISGDIMPHERTLTWDVNLDGAYGRLFSQPGQWTGFGRVRVGVLYIRDSLYMSFGPTYEISNLQLATFGLQAEVMHLESGFWFQAGGLVDTQPHPGFMVAGGWSLFGVEFQAREYDKNNIGAAPAVYGKVRLPIGIIARAFK